MKTQTPLQVEATSDNTIVESWASTQSESSNRGLLASIESLSPGRAILLICLLSVLAYANSLGGEFVFDDTDQIVTNKDIRSWGNLEKGFTTHVWAFREQEHNLQTPPPLPYYRPIFTALLTVEYHMFGLWPQGWHLVSVLLHTMSSVGVLFVLLLVSRRMLVALFASILFAVHPVHAESVSWISGMTDPLFGMFFLFSFYFYLRSRSENARAEKKGTRSPYFLSRAAFILSLGLFLAACFSKETALSLVLLVFGYELVQNQGKLSAGVGQAARRALPYAATALLYLIPRYFALGELMWKNPQAPGRPVAHTLLTLPFVVCSYLAHLAWPMNLSIAYDTHFVTTAASAIFVLPTMLLSLGVITLIAARKRVSRQVWMSLLMIFVPLLPVLKLGQVSREEYLVFDHYLYLSVAGFTYLLAIGLARFGAIDRRKPAGLPVIRRWMLSFAAMVVLLLMGIVGTARENRSWANSYELWSNAARIRPSYWAAHYNSGLALIDAGRYAEAHEALVRAAALKPDEAVVFDALGRASQNAGDAAEAEKSFRRALALEPEQFESLNNLGTLYFTTQDYPSADECFVAALKVRPDAAAVRFNLGMCRARQGRYAEAANEFERVARAGSDAEACYELALAYEKLGRLDDARRALTDGRELTRDENLVGRIDERLSRIRSETGTR